MNTENPEIENDLERQRDAETSNSTTLQNNSMKGLDFYEDENPEVRDFYSENDPYIVTNRQRETYEGLRDGDLEPYEEAALRFRRLCLLRESGKSGRASSCRSSWSSPSPDGGTDEVRIPAEIWRFNPESAIWRYISDREVVSVSSIRIWKRPMQTARITIIRRKSSRAA